MEMLDRLIAGRAWLGAMVAAVAVLAVGAVALPRTIYAGFLRKYVWDSVHDCAVRTPRSALPALVTQLMNRSATVKMSPLNEIGLLLEYYVRA